MGVRGWGLPPPALAALTAGGLAAALGLLFWQVWPAYAGGVAAGVLRTVGVVTLLAGVALAATGLGMDVFRPVRERQPAAHFGSHRVMLTTTAFAVLLAVLVSNVVPPLVVGLTGQRSLHNVPGFLSATASVDCVLLAVVYFRFIRPGVVSLADFGFGRNRLAPSFFDQEWLADLVMGLAGGVLVMLLSGTIQALLRQVGVQQTQLQEFTWVRDLSPRGFALVLLAGALAAPLAEETFFRGIVFRAYLLSKGPRVAYLVSSLVFALLHLNGPALFPILVLGTVLAWLYRSSGSLTPGVIAHGFNNGLALIVLYTQGA
jgi:membrane protease YdiL (CAAX protease family)